MLSFFIPMGFGQEVKETTSGSETPDVILFETSSLKGFSGDWVEVRYLARPDGDIIWSEPGEKVWRIQDRSFVLLGAGGLTLPPEITMRSTVFIQLETSEDLLGPFEIRPRQQRFSLEVDTQSIAQKLLAGLPGIDSTYIAQVAHFLAGNLANLDVQGTTYSVSSFGQVIDADGAWVGGKITPADLDGSLFIGAGAGDSDDGVLVPPKRNTAMGVNSLNQNFDGIYNVALGYGTLTSNVDGSYNTALGHFALYDNVSTDNNTAVGAYALQKNTTIENTAMGKYALRFNVSGSRNVAVGHNALEVSETGTQNVAIGAYALDENETGDSNTAVGYAAGPISPVNNLDQATALGHATRTTASYQVRIGSASITSIGGEVGWSTLSDDRFKLEENSPIPGLDFILGLRPMSYTVNIKQLKQFLRSEEVEGPETSEVQTGFSAQEVEKLAKRQGFQFSGIDAPPNEYTPYALRYGQFVVPLVQAIKEQQALIQANQKRILEQEKELLALKKRLVEMQ